MRWEKTAIATKKRKKKNVEDSMTNNTHTYKNLHWMFKYQVTKISFVLSLQFQFIIISFTDGQLGIEIQYV